VNEFKIIYIYEACKIKLSTDVISEVCFALFHNRLLHFVVLFFVSDRM